MPKRRGTEEPNEKKHQNEGENEKKKVKFSDEFKENLEWYKSNPRQGSVLNRIHKVISNFRQNIFQDIEIERINHEKSIKGTVTYDKNFTLWVCKVAHDCRLLFSRNGVIILHRVGPHSKMYSRS